MQYSEGFKNNLIRRMAGPEAASATALARETGISQPTLSRWLREARSVGAMAPKKHNNEKRPMGKAWSPEDKLRILSESSRLEEEDLGGFLRSEGVHEATLSQWRDAAMKALSSPVKTRRSAKSPEAKKIEILERELKRKDEALAELAALITLQKKVQAIWGDGGDDTNERKGA